MSNGEVYLPAVEGSAYWPISKDDSGREVVNILFPDDFAAPPHGLVIWVNIRSGKKVELSIPYSDTGKAL